MVALQLLPTSATREEQARSFVCGRAHVSRAHNTLTVCDGKVQQAPAVLVAHVLFPYYIAYEAVDALDRLKDRFAQDRVAKAALPRLCIGRHACLIQRVQEQSECPLRVG